MLKILLFKNFVASFVAKPGAQVSQVLRDFLFNPVMPALIATTCFSSWDAADDLQKAPIFIRIPHQMECLDTTILLSPYLVGLKSSNEVPPG